jgi:hypothetical protein
MMDGKIDGGRCHGKCSWMRGRATGQALTMHRNRDFKRARLACLDPSQLRADSHRQHEVLMPQIGAAARISAPNLAVFPCRRSTPIRHWAKAGVPKADRVLVQSPDAAMVQDCSTAMGASTLSSFKNF